MSSENSQGYLWIPCEFYISLANQIMCNKQSALELWFESISPIYCLSVRRRPTDKPQGPLINPICPKRVQVPSLRIDWVRTIAAIGASCLGIECSTRHHRLSLIRINSPDLTIAGVVHGVLWPVKRFLYHWVMLDNVIRYGKWLRQLSDFYIGGLLLLWQNISCVLTEWGSWDLEGKGSML